MSAGAADRKAVRYAISVVFISFTLLMHITFRNFGGSGLVIPFNSVLWMGFILLVAITLRPTLQGRIQLSAFHKGLGILLIILWLSFLWGWNEAAFIALPRLLGVTAGAALLLGLAQLKLTSRNWWWLGMAILTGVFLQTVLGYTQLYLLESDDWLSYWLMFNPEEHRPVGVFGQPNVVASFLVTGLVVSAWLYRAPQHVLAGKALLLVPLLVPALVAMLQSRTGWLAALLAIPLVLLYLYQSDRERFKTWGLAFLIGSVWALVAWWQPWSPETVAMKEVISGGGREPIYQHSLRMILEEPLTGWGSGRFRHDFVHSFADWRATLSTGPSSVIDPILPKTPDHPHNELLLWAIEGGLVPALAILGFALWVIYRIWTLAPRQERTLLTALLLPLALHSMTEFPFYASVAHWLAFLLLLGLVADRCWTAREYPHRFTIPLRAGLWLVVPAVWLFMATNLHALWLGMKFYDQEENNLALLDSIRNPYGAWYDLGYLRMNHDLRRIKGEVYQEYIEWWQQTAELSPSEGLYTNMLIVDRLNSRRDATVTYAEAVHLFPGIRKRVRR